MTYTPNLSDAGQALDYLAPGIRAVFDALDYGVSLADAKFSDLPHDPYLWAHFVMFGARMRLSEVEPVDWERGRDLAHSGIEIRRGPLAVRVYKSQRDRPPNPGASAARQAFWSQPERLALEFDSVTMPQAANLILTWKVNELREISLALCRPVGIWKYGEEAQIDWHRNVIVHSDSDLRFVTTDEDIVIERLDEDEAVGDA